MFVVEPNTPKDYSRGGVGWGGGFNFMVPTKESLLIFIMDVQDLLNWDNIVTKDCWEGKWSRKVLVEELECKMANLPSTYLGLSSGSCYKVVTTWEWSGI